MAKQEIGGDDTADLDWKDGLIQAGMALIDVGLAVQPCRAQAGGTVAFLTRCKGMGIRADPLAEGGSSCRTGCNFAEFRVKHGDADVRDSVEILKDPVQLLQIE